MAASDTGGKKAAGRAFTALAIFIGLTALLFFYNPSGFYLWAKAIHVIAVIAWMAGMLYLPRLFVYHADAEPGSEKSETFKVMEQRLLRLIINPAMIVTWVFGLWLAWDGFGFSGGWLHAKIALVIAMSGVHGYFSASVRRFAADQNTKPARHWRIMNEAPTLLMIVIVVLVIVKPF
ncbi:protoporphyrinogen oxidase HemJ [Nitratireductor aquimarinus]|uniref:protoporphyrinogen oxidase HemJ n=1 Tax=Alphaproteobacteria TaxID=28211 RepID=UPI000DDE1207|nr:MULTISPECIES: protoporphyrinogen oxidase HemJ [Alphaproteobacteria]MBY6022085.1 protoporphyrinogen oxidase HemJ [Nitratireductor sp. DP7N14-4]MBN7757297.1 protoporphyrinogen oxidase HemJ [Nitratireductor aquimarinus]MBN7761237.1 protoporphyrinogen oxidase HemJ [Nitratireductor aquibiodomus]MBN7777167.1 protoporphyrinogen oxidase HemJ [Nitratireductor pacificus]MBN7780838.1 protoporphyrinogen oxidase HemJ [Nitratireductor pacificus]